MKRLVWFSVVSAFSLCMIAAIGETNPTQPLAITKSVSVEGQQQITLANLSERAIQAYVLSITYQDDTGKSVLHGTSVRIKGLEPQDDGYKPGATWTDVVKLSKEERFQITVDHVLFTDGTTWGPNARGAAAKIQGTMDGWRAAHAEMKDLLDEKGVAALVDHLAGPQ